MDPNTVEPIPSVKLYFVRLFIPTYVQQWQQLIITVANLVLECCFKGLDDAFCRVCVVFSGGLVVLVNWNCMSLFGHGLLDGVVSSFIVDYQSLPRVRILVNDINLCKSS